MRKEAQQPETWKWLQPEEYWEAEAREKASRRFFQVWNATRGTTGTKTDSFIKADVPLRCTIWRSSVRNFDAILNDLILRDKEGLLDTFIQGLEQIYPDLEVQAKSNPRLAKTLLDVDALLGKGRYEHEGLKPGLLSKQEEEAKKEMTRKKSPAEEVVRAFYSGLSAFPALQKKYLEAVIDIKYLDVQRELGKGVAGYHTGTSQISGRLRPNKLLTFYLMKDPYPYLVSVPIENPDELAIKFPNGNLPESPIEGRVVPGRKTFDAVKQYTLSGNINIYVQSPKNPDYDFVTIDIREAGKQSEARRKLQQKVLELQKQSMFENVYLGKNILTGSPGFEDKKLMPGISILTLGREGEGYDINDQERDLTKLEDGGLFWVPKQGLPVVQTPTPEQSKPEGKGPYIWKGKEAKVPPSKNLFAQSVQTILGQATGIEDIWFDDQGNEYDSMEQILEKYDQESIESGLSQARDIIKDILHKELSRGAKISVPAPVIEVQEEEPVEEEILQEKEIPEEELVSAEKQVNNLVRIADLLDNKGFVKEADLIDNIIRDIIKHSN